MCTLPCTDLNQRFSSELRSVSPRSDFGAQHKMSNQLLTKLPSIQGEV
jgi:hypothetical protein